MQELVSYSVFLCFDLNFIREYTKILNRISSLRNGYLSYVDFI